MAWTTRRVISYESSLTESLTTSVASNQYPHTGQYSANGVGAYTAVDLLLDSYTSLRAGFWSKYDFLLVDTYLFRFMNGIATSTVGAILYKDEARLVNIEKPLGTIKDSIGAYATPFLRGRIRWMHYGLFTCNAIGSESTTFYVNGKAYLTCNIGFNAARLRCLQSTGIGGVNQTVDDFFYQASDDIEVDEAAPGYRYYPRRPNYAVTQDWSVNSNNPISLNSVFEEPFNSTTYIESTADNQDSIYRVQNVPFETPFGYVAKSATVEAVAKNNGQGNIKAVITDGDTEIVSDTLDLITTYGMVQYTTDFAPDRSEFNNDLLNQLSYGIRSEGIE